MKENNLYNKAYAFSILVINSYKNLIQERKEFVMSKQMLRSGTSIGANITEANGAISTADFSAKLSIAYKECLETKYWLSLLKDTGFLTEEQYFSLQKPADELARILFTILRKTRKREKQ